MSEKEISDKKLEDRVANCDRKITNTLKTAIYADLIGLTSAFAYMLPDSALYKNSLLPPTMVASLAVMAGAFVTSLFYSVEKSFLKPIKPADYFL